MAIEDAAGLVLMAMGAGPMLLSRTAHCRVIEPNADALGRSGALPQTAATHGARPSGEDSVVTAFQVIEHVEQPMELARDMQRCVAPGGVLILAGPTWPSVPARVPNTKMNAPPHHLGRASPAAFRSLASRLGLEVIEARDISGTPAQQRVYTALRLPMPGAPLERPCHHSWWLHGRMVLAGILGKLLPALVGNGPAYPGTDAILLARKP